MLVPRDVLARQDDGSYHLILDAAAFERGGENSGVSESPLVVPVIEETLAVHTTPVETGRVRIRKVVHEWEEIIDPPFAHDEVIVERVPINRAWKDQFPCAPRGIRW
jgi:stress response protein YsnF